MALESATDLAGFFDTGEHGVAASYASESGTPSGVTVNGIFEREPVQALDGFSGAAIEGERISFACASADISSPAHGDTMVISSVVYTVRGVEDDGTGVLTLVLEDA